jgi:hypothetical protein
MAWISSYYLSGFPGTNYNSWTFSGFALSVDSSNTLDYPSLTYIDSIKTFSSKKNYQYITKVDNFYSTGTSFSVAPVWANPLIYDNYNISISTPGGPQLISVTATPASPGNGYLYFYSSPTVDVMTGTYAIYKAKTKFGSNTSPTEGLVNLKIYELDFNIQGFSFFRAFDSYTNPTFAYDTLGWAYYSDSNSYSWFDSSTSSYYPCGISGTSSSNLIPYPSSNFRGNNNLNKLIPYAFFNLTFLYQKLQGGSNDGISIYLSPTLPSVDVASFSLPSGGVLVASITQSSADAQFYGLQGNQYVIIVANTGLTSSATYSSIVLSNIKIEGGYHPGNNRQYLLTNSTTYSDPTILTALGLTSAVYSTYVGVGNTINATQSLNVSQLFSKIGNGLFKSGIWENGVWNSGWRYDENVYEFYEVGKYYDHTKGKNWRFIISGPPSSVSKFSVGDKISIGNIVAIDINEDRKLIKNYFTIISVNYSTTTTLSSSNYIIVELINNFPLRRIEKDSSNHRIFITKNVWLSGAFLNGYFKGIWNYGLFKGYPLITEMFHSHWIDGVFDGGHFNSTQLGMTFSDTIYTSINLDGIRPASKVGLTFSYPHRLNVGDIIVIDKTDKTVNPSYDGEATVLEVPNEYQITTDIKWGGGLTVSEGGYIYTSISNGLVQNFDFKSHNISTITSVTSLDSDAVFVYNSWVDVNFNNYSAVNIGKSQTLLDRVSRRSYSQNNLYGYPTNDVLSSTSKFRDSFSITERDYKLGTKYKIFNDYIGESSRFEDYFGPTGPDAQLFFNQGWTYSSASFINSANPVPVSGSITFSRTEDSGVDPITGKELKVQSIGNGGVLDISTPTDLIIKGRNISSIEKQRYTVVEFDLLTYSVNSDYFVLNQDNKYSGKLKQKGTSYLQPIIHFNNVNTIVRDIYYSGVDVINILGVTTSYINPYIPTVIPATYLPIYQNIDHLSTKKYVANGLTNVPSTRKCEYFYGKTNLSMYFKGSGLYGASQSTFIIDNLNFFEIDMVPFFQYFTEDNINKSVQIPFQGIAPFIDYTNSNFSFLDNISIGFDSVSVVSSSLPVSGVGVSVGGGIVGGGIGVGVGPSFESQFGSGEFFVTEDNP